MSKEFRMTVIQIAGRIFLNLLEHFGCQSEK